jgi:aminoglycoside phosphotransferase (APT) family kinase protein
VDQLINNSEPLYLIHADLTSDHLLGKVRKGAWHTQAIIDWGDAMVGNVLYELVSIYLDLFGSEKTLLRLCLDTDDLPEFYRKDFPQKALSMVLLHQFPMPEQIYAPYRDAQSLWELADRMFAV